MAESKSQAQGANAPQQNATMSKEDKEKTSKDIQRNQEASEAAQKAVAAQKEAKRLAEAAAGAGDPEERQRLLNQALEKEVEAETFGKTAKYLQSGAFQGLIAGTGLGSGVGVGLGTVVGTLVGGTTSVVTGGIGGGIGAAIGAVNGPFFNVAEAMGAGVKKLTGWLPGWKATEEQKEALDQMVHGVQEQEVPKDEELEQMSSMGGYVDGAEDIYAGWQGDRQQRTWKTKAQSYVPGKESLPSWARWGEKTDEQKQDAGNAANGKANDTSGAAGSESSNTAHPMSKAVSKKVQPGQAVTPSAQSLTKQNTTISANNTPSKNKQGADQNAVGAKPAQPKQNALKPDAPKKTPSSVNSSTAQQTQNETNSVPQRPPKQDASRPEAPKRIPSAMSSSTTQEMQSNANSNPQKRKPRKLERPGQEKPTQQTPPQKKPPRKLEMRSTRAAG